MNKHVSLLTNTLRSAFSQAEVIVSTMLVGLVFVTALSSVGASRRSQMIESDSARANNLAQNLMSEIQRLPYSDPSGSSAIGTDSGESTRAQYDDVDDYDGLSESPPKYRDGTTIPGLTGWIQAVQIDWISASNPTTVSATNAGNARIIVTVTRNGVTLAKSTAYRCSGWEHPPYL